MPSRYNKNRHIEDSDLPRPSPGSGRGQGYSFKVGKPTATKPFVGAPGSKGSGWKPDKMFREVRTHPRQDMPDDFSLQGAMQGGMQGASTGMMAGPWGAVIGGLIGTVAGGFMNKDSKNGQPL